MSYELYVVTDERLSRGLSHVEIARRAARGGADVIQLRDKGLSGRDLYSVAKQVRAVLDRRDILFIVNDRVDVALATGADGVHLGQSDIPLLAVRAMVPQGFIIGVSVGNVEQAVEAERSGADYIALSPVFDTASKSDAGAGHGLTTLSEIRSMIDIPLVAIGGIDESNLCQVIEAGADGVAVVSAVVSQEDVESATRRLKAMVRRCKMARSQGPSSASVT
jgi:thiamine-phosphate pyrophosphorylase